MDHKNEHSLKGEENLSLEISNELPNNELVGDTQKTELHRDANTDWTEPKNQTKYHNILSIGIKYCLHVIAVAYFAYATYYYVHSQNNECFPNSKVPLCGIRFCTGYGMLIILFSLTYLGILYSAFVKPKYAPYLHRNYVRPANQWWMKFSRTRKMSFIMLLVVIICVAVFLYFETKYQRHRLIGLVAPGFFVLMGYIFSKQRNAINWRLVLTGLLWQFLVCAFCTRLEVGRSIFECLGNKVTTFLNFAKEGAAFVYGDALIAANIFAFSTITAIFLVSFFISMLYYLGAMQWIILSTSWVVTEIFGSTACVSVIVIANIFLSMTEGPLMIKPYLTLLTLSELHAIMVSGFATVAGSVLAAYLSFGASAANLITSTVMAAPGAIAFSNLFLPETEQSKMNDETIKLKKSEDSSLMDAAANGAMNAIPVVLGVIANLVAFVSFMAFLNSIVSWFFLVGFGLDGITFEWIFSKIFIPIAWSIGIPYQECDIVAKVIATKSIINEFVAYERLGTYFKNGEISSRSMGITTFAICGFANPSSIGILLGVLSVLSPTRRSDIASVVFRAFIVGSIVCFVSASFAGILMQDEM